MTTTDRKYGDINEDQIRRGVMPFMRQIGQAGTADVLAALLSHIADLEAEVGRLKPALTDCARELAYLIEQARCRPGGIVCQTYDKARAALGKTQDSHRFCKVLRDQLDGKDHPHA